MTNEQTRSHRVTGSLSGAPVNRVAEPVYGQVIDWTTIRRQPIAWRQMASATVTLTFFTPTGQIESRELSILAADGQNLIVFVEWFEDTVGVLINSIHETRRCLYRSAVAGSDFITG